MKRFYKAVSVVESEGGWQVVLDGRGVKTVKGAPQIVPTKALAKALAAEWDAQGEKIDPKSLPLRDMVDYALDIVSAEPAPVIGKILVYGDTDTLLYRADPDEPLYARQQAVWEPLVARFETEHGVTMTRVSGVIHREQNPQSLETLRAALIRFNPFGLAGIEAMASLAASLIVALSATRAEADPLALWQAASLEEDWQAEQWGRDEEAEERRARRQADFLRAREFTVMALGLGG